MPVPVPDDEPVHKKHRAETCIAVYRADPGISTATLTDESADNILRLAQFDN